MKTFTSMTIPDFFQSKTSIGRRDEIEEELHCFVCSRKIVSPVETTGKERMVRVDRTGYWAVCSEECFNMFVLQNL